ncbi:ElyC/SanA/YdcF family protein [Thioalkalivibrio nitratireducens]|uniref:ElyC/SanA/YdcF family protein n=1 Tax=Thioalkalivibrio nitratireducens TaxID=186931 RepID=UPI001F2EE5C7|nr:ElyC/SanA/YdcF family protein [Thioalkalivibrio nitratireducens]
MRSGIPNDREPGDAAAAQALGVDPARIVVLDTPTDTAREAYALREFLGTEARFVLVTSASHMPRSVQHFERVGLAPIASPTHVLTGRGRPVSVDNDKIGQSH